MGQIIRRQGTRQDLVEIVYYYIRQGTPATARRFRAQAEATFQRLADMPGMGARYEHDHPALAGVRVFPVSRFKKYLVFYRPVAAGIEILRVLHGARDLDHIMAEEFGLEEDAGEEGAEGEDE